MKPSCSSRLNPNQQIFSLSLNRPHHRGSSNNQSRLGHHLFRQGHHLSKLDPNQSPSNRCLSSHLCRHLSAPSRPSLKSVTTTSRLDLSNLQSNVSQFKLSRITFSKRANHYFPNLLKSLQRPTEGPHSHMKLLSAELRNLC